ncbi:MAG: MGMT family protein [Prevotellamassilia sp.]
MPLLLSGTDLQRGMERITTDSYGAPKPIRSWRLSKTCCHPCSSQCQQCQSLSVIVPCHRVIGSNRKLTGYGGGRKSSGNCCLETGMNGL